MPTAGLTRPDFTGTGLTPVFLYHPHTETVTKSGSEIIAVTGTASPDLARGAAGPLELTDALGRKFWRFRGADYLDLPGTFISTPRAMTIIFVARQPRPNNTISYASQATQNDGSPDGYNAAMLNTLGTSGLLPTMRAGTMNSNTTAIGRTHMAPGAQLSVFGVGGRTTANGGARFVMNRISVNTGQTGTAYVDMKGYRIGGYPKTPASITNTFDCYAVVAFLGELTDIQVDQIAEIMVDHYQIPAYSRQIILEGDSITQGVADVPAGESLAAQLTNPGANLLPDDVRVYNMGVSGNLIAALFTRRDVANGWPISLLPGGSANNILCPQIGRNDWSTRTGAAVYADIETYLTEATIGVLARGFDVEWCINIATGNSTLTTENEAQRALLRDPSFAALSPGRIGIVELDLIEFPAATRIFDSSAQSLNTTYYQGDNTHPTILATQLMASGGATPQYGIASVIASALSATGAPSFAALTTISAAALALAAAGSLAFAPMTSLSAGNLVDPGSAVGSAGVTFAPLSSSSGGALALAGVAAPGFAPLTSVSAGNLFNPVSGTGSTLVTFSPMTGAAAADLALAASAALSFAPMTGFSAGIDELILPSIVVPTPISGNPNRDYPTPQNFSLFAGDAKTLKVTVFGEDGEPVPLAGVQAVTWRLARTARSVPVLTKTLAAGVTVIAEDADEGGANCGRLDVAVESADSDALDGEYYHECQILDAAGARSAIFYGRANIAPSLN